MQKKNRGRASAFALILISVLIALAIYIFGPFHTQESQQRPSQATPVSITIIEKAPYTDVIKGLGTAIANEAVEIKAANSDYIDSVHFQDGQLIKKDDTLVQLKSDEEQANVKELQINLAEAKRQLKRLSGLAKNNATSESLLDEQEAKVKALKAQLSVAKTKLKENTITAPFNGVLGFRRVSPGTYVTSGTIITTLDDIDIIHVDFNLPEKYIPDLQLNQVIAAETRAYQHTRFKGIISGIDSRVDPITRSIQVRAEINNTEYKLRPGMLVTINVEKSVEETILVKESALIPQQDKQYVFIIDTDNKAKKVPVEIGRRLPGLVEILSGVSIGDKVVTKGGLRLRNGSDVNILGTI
ncbi:efflux RND transporter periplasmic adaptor subunit [Flocculibacter collagenilyticus]|uniref:efflux RND transporter periplasmic adaptor subunit n=1 Tax=Flocculibacter collagenilyticus TaxID=2744479 RepID=UPI0018F28F5E|nr:efflux RND transporter periplasmic adaptor subunit [Flocculibacter collagenilyticus]